MSNQIDHLMPAVDDQEKDSPKPVVDDKKKTQDERTRVLLSLAKSIIAKRDEAVKGRAASGVELRWKEDEESFDAMDARKSGGISMMDYASGKASPRNIDESGSKIIASLARSKSEVAWGRWCEMILPTDSRNWTLDVTPVPEMTNKLQDDRPAAIAETNEPITDQQTGQPMRISDVVKTEMDAAKKSMRSMEQEIDDQLMECGINSEDRKCAWDAIKLGTAVKKGPNTVQRLKKSWTRQTDPGGESAWVLKVIEEFRPELRRVDPKNVFPDPSCGGDIKKAGYVFDRDSLRPRELRQLMEVEGYEADQIKLILGEEPSRTAVVLSDDNEFNVNRTTAVTGANYERWEYNGDIDRDDLEAMGCDCSVDEVSPALSACVVLVNDRPIKIMLNPLDTGDLPFNFFQWTEVSNSIWGIGIPRLLIWWCRVLTAGWRAMLDNSGDSAGAAIVMSDGLQWGGTGPAKIGGKGLWYANGEIEDVSKSFAQFQIKNNQAELQRVIELALRFIEMESGIPAIFQGEKKEAPETLGATNIIVDANNVTLRGKVKRWDDNMVTPPLTRMYAWNMQYSEKDEIKGDYNVVALGATALVARDTQNASLIQLMQLKQDPDFNIIVDWEKAGKQWLSNQHLDVVKSDDDIKVEKEKRATQAQQQGAGADPRIQGQLQVAQVRAQGDMQKAQLVQQSDMQELELKKQQASDEFQFRQIQADQDRQFQLQLKQIDRELKIMELSQSSQQSIESIKAQLSQTAMKLNTQKELSMADNHAKQIATPPTEPKGKAQPGHAYQQ